MAEDSRKELNTKEGKELAKRSYNASKVMIDAARKGVNDSSKKASSELKKTFKELEKVQNDINNGIRGNVSELEKQADALRQVKSQLEHYGSSLEDLGGTVSGSAEDMLSVLNDTISRTDTLLRQNAGSTKAFQRSLEVSETMKKGLKSNLENSERLWKKFEKSTFLTRKYYADQLEEEQNVIENRIQWLSDYKEKYYDSLSDVDKKFFDSELEQYKRHAEEIEDLVKVAGTEITNSISAQVRSMVESIRDIAIVSAASEALSSDIDNFIENKHQVMARTGKGFNYENYRNTINRVTQESPFMSRNEFSEVYSDLVKDTRLQKSSELNYFAKDIAAQIKAYGLSADSLDRILWTDKNGGMQGTYRKVSNIAASLEDNENLYVDAARLLTSINDNIDKISYLQYQDSDKYTKMYKSLAVLESVSQSSAMKGTEDLINAVRDMGTNMWDMMDSDFARQFAVFSGAGSIQNLEKIMQEEGPEGYERLLLNYQNFFKQMSDAQLASYVKGGMTPWDTFAEAKEFLNDDLKGYLRESIASTESGFLALDSLTEDKAIESTTMLDQFQNEVSGKLGFIADVFGELDINLFKMAAWAQIAMSTADLFSKGSDLITKKLGPAISKGLGKFFGSSATNVAGTAAAESGQFLGSAVAGGGGSVAGGAAGGIGGVTASTIGAASGALVPVAGTLAGVGFAYDGAKSAFNSDARTAHRALGATEMAGGATAAGVIGASIPSAIAAGSAAAGSAAAAGAGAAGAAGAGLAAGAAAVPVVGWIALAVAGIAYLGKKAYDNATALSGNAQLVEDSFVNLKQTMEDENLTRLNILADLQKEYKETDKLENKRQVLAKSGIAKTEDLQKMSEDGLIDLLNAYTDAAKKMNSITASMVEGRKQEISETQDVQQKELMKELEEKVNSEELEGDELMQVFEVLMAGVTDEKTLKAWKKYKKDGEITKSEARDLLYGGKNSWFDEHNLTDQAVDAGALQRAYTLFSDTDTTVEAYDEAHELQNLEIINALDTLIQAYKEADTKEAQAEFKKQIAEYSEKTIRPYEFLDELKESDTYRTSLDRAVEIAEIPAFAKGISNIPNDGFAYLHEGEAVLTRDQAVKARADGGIQSNRHIGVDDFEEDTTNSFLATIMVLKGMRDSLEESSKQNEEFFDLLAKGLGLKEGSSASSGGGGVLGRALDLNNRIREGLHSGVSGVIGKVTDTLSGAIEKAKAALTGEVARTDNKNTAQGTAEDFRYQDLGSWSMPNVDDMNDWIASVAPSNSPFIGQAQAFIDAATKTGLDPRYLVAHAGLESAWGTDYKAANSNNYFGYGAFDSNVKNMYKYSYDTMEEGILGIAEKIANGYYGNGQKSLYQMRWNNGNHQYATAQNWDTAIADILSSAPENTDFRTIFDPEPSSNSSISYLNKALDYLGYKESGDNGTMFGEWIGSNGNPWCASFVSWALDQAGINNIKSARVSGIMEQAIAQGIFHQKGDGYTPRPGDIFINKGNGASHTGFVLSVNDDGTFTTVEGNSGDKVASNTRSFDSLELTGFVSMNAAEDALNNANVVSNSLEASSNLSTYAQGTPWMPTDQVAVVHQGEMIVPADNNPFNSPVTGMMSSDNSDVVEIVRWMVSIMSSKFDAILGNMSRSSTRASIQPNSDLSYIYSR